MSLATKIKLRFFAPAVFLRTLAFVLAAVLLSGNAFAEPEGIAVRVGNHDGFVRVVIDCPRLTPYKVDKTESGLRVTLTSDAAGKVLPWKSAILKKLSGTKGEGGQLFVDMAFAPGATARDYRVDNRIVFDIATKKEAAKKEPEKKETAKAEPAKPAASPAPASAKEAAIKEAAAPKPAPTAPIAITPPQKPAAPVEEKAEEKTAAAKEAPVPPAASAKEDVPPAAAAKVDPVESGPVLDDPAAIAAAKLSGAAPQALPSWNLSITQPDGGAPEPLPAVAAPKPRLPPAEDDPQSATLVVASLKPLRLAVFERFGALWIVTDAEGSDAATPQVSGPMASFITSPKTLSFKGGTAYRYSLPKKFYPHVSKKRLSWEIALTSVPPAAEQAHLSAEMKLQFDKNTHQAIMIADIKSPGDTLLFEDPEVGDWLSVVPTGRADQAVTESRQTPDFETVGAEVGLVVRPLKDGLTVRRVLMKEAAPAPEKADEKKDEKEKEEEKDSDKKAEAEEEPPAPAVDSGEYAVVIAAPFGLSVTPEGGGAITLIGTADEASDNDNNRLFDFPNWQQGGLRKYQESRSALQENAAAATTPDERASRLMDLAKFYFSNGFGQEALGILDLVATENPGIVRNPDFMAIRGAANALAGRYKEALEDLSFPAIQGRPEVSLWVGYAAAATEQWRMATRSFPGSNRLLLQYPDSIAIPFTIYMAESQLHLGHTDLAQRLLSSINRESYALDTQYKAAIDYLRGIAFAQKGEVEKAADLWEPVANGIDRLYHAKASLSLTRLQLQQKKITLKEAVDKVDSLRFAWRGNGLEVTILHTLGALKAQAGQILSGLEDMKQAADLADTLLDDSTPIREDMRRVFTDVFLSDAAQKMQPVELISVYSAFSTLLPPGDTATLAALSYIDSLIRVDLLDKAAQLMEEQLRNTLPQDKADALGTKLAAVYLLDKKPEKALLALRAAERPGLGPKTQEERTLLRARAQAQLDQTEAAIATLAPLSSKNAMKLKADVLWRAEKWAEAAAVIEGFLPDPAKPVAEDEAPYVVNAAVAWKIAGDMTKLKELRAKYEKAMASTTLGSTFGVVTRDGGAASLADRETMLNIAGEVDMFKGFLDHYKDKGVTAQENTAAKQGEQKQP